MTKLNKIQRFSGALKWVFTFTLTANPIILLLGWLNFPKPLFQDNPPISIAVMPDVPILNAVPMGNMILAIGLSLIPTLLTMGACYFLVKLFKSYESGEIFNISGVTYFKRIAQFLFFRELINPFYQAAISATLTWNNPPGKGLAVAGIGSENLYTLIVATVILLISWIMAEAYSIHQEQQYTI